jgi:hypothetical protein
MLNSHGKLGLSSGGLAGLEVKDFVGIADALFFVGVGGPGLSDVGGHFSNLLLVETRNMDAVVAFHGEDYALRGINFDGVAVADVERNALAPLLDAVAYAHELEGLLIALGDALNGVGDEGSGEAVEGAVKLSGRGPFYEDASVPQPHVDLGMEGLNQDAFWAFDGNPGIFQVHLYVIGYGYGSAAHP